MNRWRTTTKTLLVSLITVIMVLSLVSCGNYRFAELGGGLRAATQAITRNATASQPTGNISEVSPPEVIQQLSLALEAYQPQVAILSPQLDEVLQDNTVTIRFQVQDLPLFKNTELDLGTHLQVILDNQPYINIYDLNQPLVLSDLPPGTHTLRVFASRPWYESFKNEGAYAQTTFHIFTKTQDNNPDPAQPLLTYSSPQGSYGAEPILLDFYLTNAPLHLVAQEKPNDDIADWRIRCTINGNSFVMDRWQPLYLKGFKPGKNWVQLEFINEQGNTVKNVFNSTVRLITYEPKGKDTLSKLVRGELLATEARGIVDPNYTAKTPSTTPTLTPSPNLPSEPATSTPIPTLPTAPTIEKTPEIQANENKQVNPEIEPSEINETQQPEVKQPQNKKLGGFFNRFRRPPAIPSPSLPPTLPEIIESPAPEPIVPQIESTPEPEPLVKPQEETTRQLESAPSTEVEPKAAEESELSNSREKIVE